MYTIYIYTYNDVYTIMYNDVYNYIYALKSWENIDMNGNHVKNILFFAMNMGSWEIMG